jgi:hypothetical protein
MSAVSVILHFLAWSVAAGGVGALAMALVLWGFTRSGLTNARMVIAVGSLLTRSYENALLVGAFVHGIAGVLFGMVYTLILMVIGKPGVGPNLLLGVLLGGSQGLLVALSLVAVVADVHPLEEFRQRGFAIALSHWVGHMVYGLVVGGIIGASGLTALG